MKEILGDRVEKVAVSNRIADSPCVLVKTGQRQRERGKRREG
jgi:molecular chaperone HtpG